MRIDTAESLLEGCRLIFLDTADWSYMEDGRQPEAAAELRALCADGRARILVTADHLLEIGGLTSGRSSRLRFMHSFPGTVLLPVGGSQVTKLAAYDFAFAALDGDMEPQALRCQEMSASPIETLTKAVEQTWVLDLAQRFQAWATSASFSDRKKSSKQDVEMHSKMHRLARKGDTQEVMDYLRKRRPLSGLRGIVQNVAGRALVALYQWGNDRGILSVAAKNDFLFDELVSGALPRQLSSNPQIMGLLFELWSRPDALALHSPSLACVAAIARRSSPTRKTQKIRSTENDKRHAAFAPLVDVFTCDRRVQPIISQTLKVARSQTAVLRTSCLADVVAALKPSVG